MKIDLKVFVDVGRCCCCICAFLDCMLTLILRKQCGGDDTNVITVIEMQTEIGLNKFSLLVHIVFSLQRVSLALKQTWKHENMDFAVHTWYAFVVYRNTVKYISHWIKEIYINPGVVLLLLLATLCLYLIHFTQPSFYFHKDLEIQCSFLIECI